MYTIRKISRKIQNFAMNGTEAEDEVRSLTNTDAWGPSSEQLYRLNMSVLAKQGNIRIVATPLRVDLLPSPAQISYSSKVVFSLFYRLFEYGNIAIVMIPFDKLKFHMDQTNHNRHYNQKNGATMSHQLYENFKKSYINQGVEFRIMQKCLTVLEYLLAHCFDDDYDILLEVASYKPFLAKIAQSYTCDHAVDHRMKLHTDSIRRKAQDILDLVNHKTLLQRKRHEMHKVSEKIHQDGYETHGAAIRYNDQDFVAQGQRSEHLYDSASASRDSFGGSSRAYSTSQWQDQSQPYDSTSQSSEQLQEPQPQQLYDSMQDDDYLRNSGPSRTPTPTPTNNVSAPLIDL